ncbi:MAG: hypothetical protein P1P85_02950 [Patescibacteria group bacterium]|nr:hypothetical protein [Patescibacteria group bacterium]
MKNIKKKVVDYLLLKSGFAFMHTEVQYICKKCGEHYELKCEQDLEFCSNCGGRNTDTKKKNEIVVRRSLKDCLSDFL